MQESYLKRLLMFMNAHDVNEQRIRCAMAMTEGGELRQMLEIMDRLYKGVAGSNKTNNANDAKHLGVQASVGSVLCTVKHILKDKLVGVPFPLLMLYSDQKC